MLADLHRIWTGMTPAPPRDFVAFVAAHLPQLRYDAQLLAGDEYEAHELYSQALTDLAVRWQWFALLRRMKRQDTADAYLHETLVRRSIRRQAEQADFVEFEVWFSDQPQAARGGPAPSAPSPARRSGTARMLPMSSLGIEVGPVAEAAVAWWHAYVVHRQARLGAMTAAIALAMTIVVPFLQRH
jgi:hypothetical protein